MPAQREPCVKESKGRGRGETGGAFPNPDWQSFFNKKNLASSSAKMEEGAEVTEWGSKFEPYLFRNVLFS